MRKPKPQEFHLICRPHRYFLLQTVCSLLLIGFPIILYLIIKPNEPIYFFSACGMILFLYDLYLLYLSKCTVSISATSVAVTKPFSHSVFKRSSASWRAKRIGLRSYSYHIDLICNGKTMICVDCDWSGYEHLILLLPNPKPMTKADKEILAIARRNRRFNM